MKYIEINKLDNGGHNNQTCDFVLDPLPEGWAVIPEDMETPNFPFGDITTEEKDGVVTVTSWTALPIPEPEPEPIDEESTTLDLLADHEERLCMLELNSES